MNAEKDGKVVNGVKGKSTLSSQIDIVEAVPVDYMLEGVSRRLLSTCIDSKNHTCRFYLGTVTKEIDEKLQQIKPPPEFCRSPRSVSSMKQWKASEFRAWLLYYSIPVLTDILPADYIYHLSLLVSALHILLDDAILLTDIDKAHALLEHFYQLAPGLYNPGICTANMHYLSRCVRNWGPLWGYSCFGFESMNGHLRKSCHGTRLVLPQLIHNVRMQQLLPIQGEKNVNTSSPDIAAFVRNLADISEKSTKLEVKSRITHRKPLLIS